MLQIIPIVEQYIYKRRKNQLEPIFLIIRRAVGLIRKREAAYGQLAKSRVTVSTAGWGIAACIPQY